MMKWRERSKRNSVAQEKSSKEDSSNSSSSTSKSSFLRGSSSTNNSNGHSSNNNTSSSASKTAQQEFYASDKGARSTTSLSSTATKDALQKTISNSSQAPMASSSSAASITTTVHPTAQLVRTHSIVTLAGNDDAVSTISRSFNKLSTTTTANTTTTAATGTTAATANTNNSQRPFTFENYDSSHIKTGWLNKGSNISNWNNANSETWKVYKAELRGPILSLYKLPNDFNIKSFDPQLGQPEPAPQPTPPANAPSAQVRQKRLSSNASRANLRDKSTQDLRAPTSTSAQEHQQKNYRIKLKYLSEVYPHPDLQLNSSNSIVSGTLESICHTILFNTLEDDKLSYNLLLIMPLLGDIKASLKYFIEYSLTFTSQRIYRTANNPVTKLPISPNTDYAITQRLGLVITTIIDSFPGMLLDDDIYELSNKLIAGISQHDEHLAENLKKSIPKKHDQMKNLTSFKSATYDPQGSQSLTNVDNFLNLDSKVLAYQINSIDLQFNKHWNPKNDPSLLYELENVSYSRLNPLIFNSSSNIHYLGRLLVAHLFGALDSKMSEAKRCQILSKWIEIGCIFDKIGDMVSWLAIATTICSIPILRLRKSWSLVDEKYLKIISTEWAPVVFELDRRTMISEASHRSSYHVIAPQGLGITYSKNDVVPYFGDLTVKYVENSTLKQCEKKVQRVKVSFSRWDEYLQNVTQNDTLFENGFKANDEELNKELFNLLTNHVQLPPLTQDSVMQLSLTIEPDANGEYYKVHDSRTPLVTGSYLPTLFSEIVPTYKLFNQDVLIGASGFPTKTEIPVDETEFPEVTGVDDVDAQSYVLNSNLPSSKSQHKLLKSVRDIFNIGSDVFHVDEELIFKSLSKDDELKSSRPASVVLENPSSKRLSQISASNRLSIGGSVNGNDSQIEDDVFAILDNSQLLSSLVKPLNVVLKAGTFERMIDVLVLTSNVFSKKINKSDIDSYLEKSNLLDNQFLKLKMNNGVYTSTFFSTYKSFSTTSALLESLSARFLGSKSAALSIQKLNADSVDVFPDWTSEVQNDDPSLNWKFVGNIQIGVLEALSILVSDHYNDFTDNLQNKAIFVDLLRIIDNEIVVEWKEVLNKLDNLELKNELTEIYNILSTLYKKIRKNYIKKCYRPFDLFPKDLPSIDTEYEVDFNELELPKDFREAEIFVKRLDDFINELFQNSTFNDWINVFQILEIQSSKSLTSLFKYKQTKEEDLTVLNIYSWLKTLYGDSIEDKVLNKFPPPIKLLFELHNNLEKYFKLQIVDPSLTRDVRTSRMVSILQILTISRLRMKQVDLFLSADKNSISPHVPSFIETAITQVIVSPESRSYSYSWVYASSALKDEPVETVDQVLDLLPKLDVDDLNEDLKKGLTPCVGWFVEILLSISNFVPNMSIENSKLINFDKRRFTYNCITNIVDMNSDSIKDEEIDGSFDILFKLSHYKEFELEQIKKVAELENKEYPKYDSDFKLFTALIVDEVAKNKRDATKKETLDNQERDIKRTQFLAQARASINLNRDLNNDPQQQQQQQQQQQDAKASQAANASGKGKQRQNSPSKVSGVGKRLGGLFKSVRPFSINVGSNWSNSDKVIHPDDLPDLNSVHLVGKYAKPYLQLKVFNAKPLFVHSNIEGFFKIVNEIGDQEFCFQATNNNEAQSWIAALNLAKRYSYLSKDARGLTSSKVFGVPIADLCEREGTLVPNIVERLLQEIEVRGLDETGLYRIPGSVGSINLLKQAFDEGGDFTLEDDRWFEINTLAGCFKLYLRELPETLFTVDLLPEFVQATKQGDLIENLKVLIKQLPLNNYHLLKRLFEHLNKVIEHAEKNRMDAVNLAIVFSMSFLNNENLGMSMGNDLGALQNILQQLIKAPELVFQEQFNDDVNTIVSVTD